MTSILYWPCDNYSNYRHKYLNKNRFFHLHKPVLNSDDCDIPRDKLASHCLLRTIYRDDRGVAIHRFWIKIYNVILRPPPGPFPFDTLLVSYTSTDLYLYMSIPMSRTAISSFAADYNRAVLLGSEARPLPTLTQWQP